MNGISKAAIEAVSVAAYTIPTDMPESDGTLAWQSTTLVLAHVQAAGVTGLGYTYADVATAKLIEAKLAHLLIGADAWETNRRWLDLVAAIRNLGRPGICSMAIAALDTALWDLKAKLLGVSLAHLLGPSRSSIAVYGSGGFTSYSCEQLCSQLASWVEEGISRVKMKIGRAPADDPARVAAARRTIGSQAALYVDANGAYTRKQALAQAHAMRDSNVSWLEEPVSSDDLEGLHLLRERAPAGMDITAGEYGYDATYFRRMLAAGAVDVLQADATRCGGITGFLAAAALAEAFAVPFSSHCAPSLHLPLCCAVRPAIHLEYFHDHVRIEQMFFDGFITPREGSLAPDFSRPGLGISFKEKDAQCYRVL